MSNKEIEEFNEKLRRGLELAEKRMLGLPGTCPLAGSVRQ